MIAIWTATEPSTGELLYKDFWKLLTNTSHYALNEDLPNDFKVKDALNLHINMQFKYPESQPNAITFINIYEGAPEFYGNQNGSKYNMSIVVDVITHTNTCIIEDKLGKKNNRLYYLQDMIINLIGDTKIESFAGNAHLKSPFRSVVYNNDFQGYKGVFEVRNLKRNDNFCQGIGSNNE